MSITLTQVKNEIVTALVGYQPLKDFCQTEFSKDLKVYAGVDFQDPPNENDAPFITVHRNRHGGTGEGDAQESWHMALAGAVVNEDIEETSGADYKILNHTGEDQLEAMLYLAIDALKNLPNPLKGDTSSLNTTDSEFYPLFLGDLEVNISLNKTLGGFPNCIQP